MPTGKANDPLGHYAKVSVRDLRGAVESLPAVNSAPEPDAMAATGTLGQHIDNRFALPLPYGGDRSGRELSATVAMTFVELENDNTPETLTDKALGRVQSVPDGSGTERGDSSLLLSASSGLDRICVAAA
jgi:hypothetical protein